MTAPRVTIIGVGNLIEVIWPTLARNLGGDDVAERFIGVTADEPDVERKAALFGFDIVLRDNLAALRRNEPDVIMFAPPPSRAAELIDSVLRPYYAERRADPSDRRPLPDLYAFPPVPPGSAYREILGTDVLVANIIPNNVTAIGGIPTIDEGYYVCTFASPWPEDRLSALRSTFDGQGAFVRLEPHQLVPMLGAAATVSALWFAVPEIAERTGVDHNELGQFLRSHLSPDSGPAERPGNADLLAAIIGGWHAGVRHYYERTDIDPGQVETLIGRGFDLTLHTIEVEPRETLIGHSVGAATKGGVLEKALDLTRSRLLPAIEAERLGGPTPGWERRFAAVVTETCHDVCDHGATLGSKP